MNFKTLALCAIASGAAAEDLKTHEVDSFLETAISHRPAACEGLELMQSDVLTQMIQGLVEVQIASTNIPPRPADLDLSEWQRIKSRLFEVPEITAYRESLALHVTHKPIEAHGSGNHIGTNLLGESVASGHYQLFPNDKVGPAETIGTHSLGVFRAARYETGEVTPYFRATFSDAQQNISINSGEVALSQSCTQIGNAQNTNLKTPEYNLSYSGSFAGAGFCEIISTQSQTEVLKILESLEISTPLECGTLEARAVTQD